MPKRKVREDEEGIYVIDDGLKARPGDVVGYSHAFRMDGGGLKCGDEVKARHVSQTPMVKVTTSEGVVLLWEGSRK